MTNSGTALDIAIGETLNEWRGAGWYMSAYDNNSLTCEVDWYDSATSATYAIWDAAMSANDPTSALLVWLGDGDQPQGY